MPGTMPLHLVIILQLLLQTGPASVWLRRVSAKRRYGDISHPLDFSVTIGGCSFSVSIEIGYCTI